MASNKDFTKMTFVLTVTVIAILIALSFVPPFRIGKVMVKRANILSDVINFDDADAHYKTSQELLDTSFLELIRPSSDSSKYNTENKDPEAAEEKKPIEVVEPNPTPTIAPSTSKEIIPIEDFSPSGEMMNSFYHALAYEASHRPVRIAVLGDSFIEGDILTADLREQLQQRYGGNGVGFTPFATPLSKYRGTVRHEHEGWETHNIIKIKQVPEEYRPWFFISGNIAIPQDGATTEYSGVKFRKHIESTNTASLLFVNRGNSSLEVTINNTHVSHHTPPSSEKVECITFEYPDISKLKVKVTEPEGFIGYGVVLEDDIGVSVHNFSVRSNSGMALFATDHDINYQINELMNYDLIILQYGLNVMSPDVSNYSYYERQLCRMIDYIGECFPESAIMVMSVSDRSILKGGSATSIPTVDAMIQTQRDAAMKTGVGFWNLFEAMGGKNSMPKFVDQKMASKDYTHINYPGGKQVADKFIAYLDIAVDNYCEQNQDAIQERIALDKEKRERQTELSNSDTTHQSTPAPVSIPQPEEEEDDDDLLQQEVAESDEPQYEAYEVPIDDDDISDSIVVPENTADSTNISTIAPPTTTIETIEEEEEEEQQVTFTDTGELKEEEKEEEV